MTNHANLLDAGNSLLGIIDMQSRLYAAMPELDAAGMALHTNRLLAAVKLLSVPVILTEQYPEGLGATIPEIAGNAPADCRVFRKTAFSCAAVDEFRQALADSGRRQIVLAGQEAHICVLQTTLDLLHLGYQVYVVEDTVCSRRPEHKAWALRRMQQQGATIICHESVLFEWLKDSKHADFKVISSLLR